ncbi:MAG: orotate phosphoribosyltransferase [SAR324 cluster bacterium]|jgi:orotate phosphoribosyltransferase|nr:orotate phosphoribosyltransferase [SAR324 cluster bacterium]|tara:strand:- start:197 stop:871 length:675 start_codon:yes stop_codon:yes gene_type:complete
MQTYKKKFAEFLVRADALQFGEFTLKSGRSSPYFFNSSKFNNGPLIEELGSYYAAAIEENAPNCNLIYGPAYKGIPLCISTAIALSARLNQNIGYFFNRKEKKTHGDQGTLVGQFPLAGDSVVMVDDVITDGLTKIESVKLIRELCKVEFSGVLVALDRMEKNSQDNDAITEFQQKTSVPVWSIITIREICDYLKNRKIGGSVVLDESTFLKIENYLAVHSVRS